MGTSNINIPIAVYGLLCYQSSSDLSLFNHPYAACFLDKDVPGKFYGLKHRHTIYGPKTTSGKLRIGKKKIIFKPMYDGLKLLKIVFESFNKSYYSVRSFDLFLTQNILFTNSSIFAKKAIADSRPKKVNEAMSNGLSRIVSIHRKTAGLLKNNIKGFTYLPHDTFRVKTNEKAQSLSYDNFLAKMHHAIASTFLQVIVNASNYNPRNLLLWYS